VAIMAIVTVAPMPTVSKVKRWRCIHDWWTIVYGRCLIDRCGRTVNRRRSTVSGCRCGVNRWGLVSR
jgi:hypothetical protein